MADKTIIIIGAGVAGLATGCYSQMNGYGSQIFETNSRPGGLCVTWERKGYTIDGGPDFLLGTSPRSSYYHFWQEVGALQGKQVINLEHLARYENADGQAVDLFTDIDRLDKHLKTVAPEDSALIEELTRTVRRLAGLELPADKAPELYGTFDNLKLLQKVAPYIREFQKWRSMTTHDFILRFQNPLLRKVLFSLFPEGFAAVGILMTLTWFVQKNAGYIIGGSMGIVKSMEKRYYDLGGKINYAAKVETILVENGVAVGVKLADGSEHRADRVISAADGHSTIWEMLGGKFLDETIKRQYEMPIYPPLVFIGLGVKRTFEDMPPLTRGLTFTLTKPLIIGNREHQTITVRIYNYDPSFAPAGKTALNVAIETDFAYWSELRQDNARYKAEKERISAAVIEALNQRFPGITSQVEMCDVATPTTYYHYTGNWQGSYRGWLMTPTNLTMRMKKTLPGLENFFMTGQWVQPGGGLSGGLMTGSHIMQILCKGDKRKFCAVAP